MPTMATLLLHLLLLLPLLILLDSFGHGYISTLDGTPLLPLNKLSIIIGEDGDGDQESRIPTLYQIHVKLNPKGANYFHVELNPKEEVKLNPKGGANHIHMEDTIALLQLIKLNQKEERPKKKKQIRGLVISRRALVGNERGERKTRGTHHNEKKKKKRIKRRKEEEQMQRMEVVRKKSEVGRVFHMDYSQPRTHPPINN